MHYYNILQVLPAYEAASSEKTDPFKGGTAPLLLLCVHLCVAAVRCICSTTYWVLTQRCRVVPCSIFGSGGVVAGSATTRSERENKPTGTDFSAPYCWPTFRRNNLAPLSLWSCENTVPLVPERVQNTLVGRKDAVRSTVDEPCKHEEQREEILEAL